MHATSERCHAFSAMPCWASLIEAGWFCLQRMSWTTYSPSCTDQERKAPPGNLAKCSASSVTVSLLWTQYKHCWRLIKREGRKKSKISIYLAAGGSESPRGLKKTGGQSKKKTSPGLAPSTRVSFTWFDPVILLISCTRDALPSMLHLSLFSPA